MVRVAVIRRGLLRDAHNVEDQKHAVNERGEEWRKGRRNVHDHLCEEDEHGEDAYDHVPVSNAVASQLSRPSFYQDVILYAQLVPRRWCFHRLVVGSCVQELDRIAIPAMLRTLAPERGPVGIWIGETEQCETGNGEGKLKNEKYGHNPAVPPVQLAPPR